MNPFVEILSFAVRRFPFEAGRWRFASPAINWCKSSISSSVIRKVRTRYGFYMSVDVSEWLGRHVFATGEYEPATSRMLATCLRPGDTFLDIGANAGYFSLLAARIVGPTGKVVAFEPHPRMQKDYRHNVDLNHFQTICDLKNVALSNSHGEAEFFAGPDQHPGVSSLRAPERCSSTFNVPVATYDELIGPSERVDCLKIDVEGAECCVLEGMTNMLAAQLPIVVLEVTPSYLAKFDRKVDILDSLLTSLGYLWNVIGNERISKVAALRDVESDQFNAIAYVPSRHITRLGPLIVPA